MKRRIINHYKRTHQSKRFNYVRFMRGLIQVTSKRDMYKYEKQLAKHLSNKGVTIIHINRGFRASKLLAIAKELQKLNV